MQHRYVFLLFAVASSLLADTDDWGRVKALPSGSRLTVVQSGMKSTHGTLDSASDSEIVVDGASIPRANVVRISLHKVTHRVTNALIFGLVGGLVGAGATRFGVACAETNDGCRNAALKAYGGVAIGAAAGAFALPDSVEVYRVKKLASTGTSGHSE